MAKEALKKQIDKNTKPEFDSVIFYTTMTLVFIGIIMVFSASFVQSAFKHGDSYYFLKRNMIYATLGFISMMVISNIDYRFWKKNAKGIISNVEVFDIYKGSNLEEGYKSIAISINYQSKDHTLKDDEILPVHNNILTVLQKDLAAELRK